MDYLLHYPPKKNLNILVVGCGTGCLTSFCHVRLEAASIVCMDHDPAVIPLMGAGVLLNHHSVKFIAGDYNSLDEKHIQGMDLLLGSDICYYEQHSKEVHEMIRAFFKHANDQARVVLGIPYNRIGLDALVEKCNNDETLNSKMEESWRHISDHRPSRLAKCYILDIRKGE